MYHHESEEIYKLLNYDAILFDVDGTLSLIHISEPTRP